MLLKKIEMKLINYNKITTYTYKKMPEYKCMKFTKTLCYFKVKYMFEYLHF